MLGIAGCIDGLIAEFTNLPMVILSFHVQSTAKTPPTPVATPFRPGRATHGRSLTRGRLRWHLP